MANVLSAVGVALLSFSSACGSSAESEKTEQAKRLEPISLTAQQLFEKAHPLMAAVQKALTAEGPGRAYAECFEMWEKSHQAGDKLFGNIELSIRVLQGHVDISALAAPTVDTSKKTVSSSTEIEPALASCIQRAFSDVKLEIDGVEDASYVVSFPFCMKSTEPECPAEIELPPMKAHTYFEELPRTDEKLHPLFARALRKARASEDEEVSDTKVVRTECRCSVCRVAHGAASLELLNQWSVAFQQEFLRQVSLGEVEPERFRMTNVRPRDITSPFAGVMFIDYSDL